MTFDFVLFTGIMGDVIGGKSMGAYQIANCLREAGYTALVVDNIGDYSYEELLEVIDVSIGSNTLAVGVSTTFLADIETVFTSDDGTTFGSYKNLLPQGKNFSEDIHNYIKKINPKINFIAGGQYAKVLLLDKKVNFIVLGYGDSVIVEIADYLSFGKPLQSKYYKSLGGAIVIEQEISGGNDFDFQKQQVIWQDIDVVNAKVLPIEIGRGCIFNCKFCDYPMRSKKNLDFVKGSSSLKDQLLTNWEKYGIRHYTIVDDTFNDNIEKLNQIESVIKQLPFQPIFWSYLRLDLVAARDNFQQLYDIGIRYIHFGIETLNKAAAKIVGKSTNPEKLVQYLKKLNKEYPDVQKTATFIVGLPHESEESVRNTHKRIIDGDVALDSFRFIPLTIRKQVTGLYSSEFEKNWQKWGFRDTGNSSKGSNSHIMHWEHDHMNIYKAMEITADLNKVRGREKLNGSSGRGFMLINYVDEIAKAENFKDALVGITEEHIKQLKKEWISDYKIKLLSLLKER